MTDSSTSSDAAEPDGAADSDDLERWASSTFLEKVTGVLPSVIYVFNQKTQSNEYANRSLGEAMGFSPQEVRSLGAELMPQLCHPEDLPRMGEYFEALRKKNDGEISQFEYRMRHKDGGWTWLLSHDTVFERDEDGSVVRHIGVASDITAQKNAEAALTRANERLAAVNEELADLTYVATHDMLAPIANITGLTDLLAEAVDDENPRANELIELIQRSCDKATERIRALVRVTQARAADEATQPSVVNLAESIGETLDQVALQLDLTEATVELDLRIASVRFNEVSLQSILHNLIGNAVKYADPSRPLELRIASAEIDGHPVLTVSDNGVGIDVDNEGREIFELFKQGRQPSVEGSGVGLYLVKKLMERSDGSISLRSAPDGGAEFVLTFAHNANVG